MAVVHDTYVLDAKTPDFAGLGKVFDQYLKQLNNVETATKKALSDPKAANLTQKQLESLVAQLDKVKQIRDQLSSERSDILGGVRNVDLSKTIGAITGLKREVLDLQDALSSAGKSTKFLDKVATTARAASGRGMRLAAASNAGDAETLGRNQLMEAATAKALGGLTARSGDTANAKLAVDAGKAFGLEKLAGDTKIYEQTLRAMAAAAARGATDINALGAAGATFINELKGAPALINAETAALKKNEEASKAAADQKKKETQARVEAGKQLNADIRATRTAVGQFTNTRAATTRFNNLGPDGSASALKDLTKIYSELNLTTKQQEYLADRVLKKYEELEKATRALSFAHDNERVKRADLRTEAATRVQSAVTTGTGLSAESGSKVLGAVQERIDSGELRSSLQIRRAIVAEMEKERRLAAGIVAENRINFELSLAQKKGAADLTDNLTRVSRTLGYHRQLHGDMRSVMAQTVAEAQKLGYTFANNRAELEALLQVNVQLKTLEAASGPKELNQFGVAFAAGFAAQQVGTALAAVINRFSEFEDQMIKVRRTADATRSTMTNLGLEILDIGQNVPVAAKELAAAAGVLGQTGAINFNNKDLARNSEEMQDAAKAITLVAQTSLVAEMNIEQASTAYGQFSQVFAKDITRIKKELEDQGVAGAQASDAMRVLFGSINEVGNKTVATTEDLMDFTKQFAGIGTSLGITAEQIIALGGAFRDFQVGADVAGTAATRFFSRAVKDADEFGKVIGVSSEAFKAQFSGDSMGTMLKVLGELNKQTKTNKLAFVDFANSLKLETRERNAIGKLVENFDLLQPRLALGKNTLENYNSVQAEADKRAETWSAAVTKLSNAFQALVQTLQPAVEFFSKVVIKVAEFVKSVADLNFTAVAATVVVITGGVAYAVLQAVKLVTQFQLATKALADMGRQMAENNRIQNPSAPPVGRASRILGGAAAVAGIVTVGAILGNSGSTNDAKEAGVKDGKAYGEGVVEGASSTLKANEDVGWTDWLKKNAGDIAAWSTTALLALSAVAPYWDNIARSARAAWAWMAGGTYVSMARTALTTLIAPVVSLAQGFYLFGPALTVAGAGFAGVAVAIAAVTAAGYLLGNWLFDKFDTETNEARENVAALERQLRSLEAFQKGRSQANENGTGKNLDTAQTNAEKLLGVNDALLKSWKAVGDSMTDVVKKYNSMAEAQAALGKETSLLKSFDIANQMKDIAQKDLKVIKDNVKSLVEGAATEFARFDSEVTMGLNGENIYSVFENITDVGSASEVFTKMDANIAEALAQAKLKTATLRKAATEDRVAASAVQARDPELAARFGAKAAEYSLQSGRSQANVDQLKLLQQAAVKQRNAVIAGIHQRNAAETGAEITTAYVDEQVRKIQEGLTNQAQDQLGALRKFITGMNQGTNVELEGVAARQADKIVQFEKLLRDTALKMKKAGNDPALIADTVGKLREEFAAEFTKNTTKAISDDAKRTIKEQFAAIKEASDEYFSEIELAREERALAARESKNISDENVRKLENDVKALQEKEGAYKRLGDSLKAFEAVGESAMPSTAAAAKSVGRELQGTLDTLVDAAYDMQSVWEIFGKSTVNNFAAVKKAAKDTATVIKQSAFDFGREQGAKAVQRNADSKEVTKTLRQSSTAKDLIASIQRVRSGSDPVEMQGAKIGALVETARQKFEKQGVDASKFMAQLESELGDLYKNDGKTANETAAAAVKAVGATTNSLLTEIATILGGGKATTTKTGADAAQAAQTDAVWNIRNKDGPNSPATAREAAVTESQFKDRVAAKEKQIRGIRDKDEKAAQTAALLNEKEEFKKSKFDVAIKRTLASTGVGSKLSNIKEADTVQVKAALDKLLSTPEFKGVFDKADKKELFKEVNIVDLQKAKDLAQNKAAEALGGKDTPVESDLGSKFKTATDSQTAYTEKMTSLLGKFDLYLKKADYSAVNERIKALEVTVDAAINH